LHFQWNKDWAVYLFAYVSFSESNFSFSPILNVGLQDWRLRSPRLFHNVGIEYRGNFLNNSILG
jgi:hypothetical protein